MPTRRPVLDAHYQTSVRGLYVVGDLAGAPLLKMALEQGHEVAEHIASTLGAGGDPEVFDLAVAGAGAAGLNAALTAQERGLRVVVFEKNRVADTIEDFPEGKWIYAEPEGRPAKGRLWLESATKDDLLARWSRIVRESGLDVRTGVGVEKVTRAGNGEFEVRTTAGVYRARRVLVACGQQGTPRRLGVPGEEGSHIQHRLYDTGKYRGERILIVGGGNTAVEAALVLARENRVILSYRGSSFTRVSKENRRKLQVLIEVGTVTVILNSNVERFNSGNCVLKVPDGTAEVPYDHAFILIGTELPEPFLRALGIRLENEWTARRFAWLAFAFLLAYTICAVKLPAGFELWPFRGWGARAFTFFSRSWGFSYTVLYTLVMTAFGIPALKRWGIGRRDRFQIWRYVSLIGFQWIFFFLIPEFVAHTWRAYGLVYAWPLFFYTFLGGPGRWWVVWGLALTFVIIPVLVLFHGKRYCSWVCGCGGLAETLGDRWRHLAPKGSASLRWERMNTVVLWLAVLVTLLALARDSLHILQGPANLGLEIYHALADLWLVAIIPLALYPFFGGKIWCRYWCPLAKLMEMWSALYNRLGVSRFGIRSNDKCIACGECTRNCQVGIDVMSFALKQEPIHNGNTSCIGCGICVTVCPMGVLSFGRPGGELVQIRAGGVPG